MAVSAGFKQKCPTCEALVPIKDAGLIGRKMECPKCKDRFVVEDPAARDQAAITAKAGKSNGKAAPAKGQTKRFRDDEDEDDEDEAPPAKAKTNGKANGKAAPVKRFRDEEAEDDDDAPDERVKKKSGGSKKLIGLAIAGVGLVVLAVAGFFIIGGGGGSGANNNRPAVNPNPNPGAAIPEAKIEEKAPENANPNPAPAGGKNMAPAGVEVTNLLPNETEHVLHVNLRNLFDPTNPFRDLAFNAPGALSDDQFRQRLGFSLLAMDTLIRADCYSAGWTYAVAHFTETVDQQAVIDALGLTAAPAINGQNYYRATRGNPWHEELARLSFGVPLSHRNLAPRENRPVFVKFHNPQTVIFADEAPIVALLRANGQFRLLTELPAAPAEQNPNAPPGMPGMMPPGGLPGMMPPGGMPPGTTPPGGMPPGVPPGMPPGMPPGRGSQQRGALDEEAGSGIATTAQVAPTIIAPPLNFQNPAGQAPAGAAQGAQGNSLDGQTWSGSETLRGYGKLAFTFAAGNSVTMQDKDGNTNGSYDRNGNSLTLRFGGGVRYTGTIAGNNLSGDATNGQDRWKWNVSLQGGQAAAPPMGNQPPGMPPGMPNMMPPNMMPNMPGGNPAPVQNTVLRSESYLTIRPHLKQLLDRIQYKSGDSKDKLFFSSVTDLSAARIESKLPEFKNRVIWQPRQVWDFTQMLEERRPRIKTLATALFQREPRIYQYRTELDCIRELDAKELQKDVIDKAAPQLARSFERLLNHAIELPKGEAPPAAEQGPPGMFPGGMRPPGVPPGAFPPGGGAPPANLLPGGGAPPANLQPGGGAPPANLQPGGGAPPANLGMPPGMPGMPGEFPGMPGGFNPNQLAEKPEEMPKASKLSLTLHDSTLNLKLDLVFDQPAIVRLNSLVTLVACAMRSEIDLAAGAFTRHDLARAAEQLGERGVSDRGVAPGRYPPGAFKRSGTTRLAQLPYHRMSWMAGLLPFLGHETIYHKIDWEKSWQEPNNWLAARTIVPQFLDPQYPDSARFTSPPGLGVEMAATNVVGITGIGLDAAEYPRDDPAYVAKRGVFSYEGAASIDEIRAGRGLSNTMVMVQIPHDGPGGVSPWIAGGGATLRGVPEKGSIAPFVLTNDRNGKPIQYAGKRGTYVVMADGSVRFVTANVADDVFKAMATISGPAPENFDLNKSDTTPLVPVQKAGPAPIVPTGKQVGPLAGGELKGDAKAFHDGVVKSVGAMQQLEQQSVGTILSAGKDKLKLEAAMGKAVADAKIIVQGARQLKAPAGKEGQEYFDAFKAFLDFQDQGMETEVKLVLEVIGNPTPEGQAKLMELSKVKIAQQVAVQGRLQSAQQAFLRANSAAPVVAPAPQVAAPQVAAPAPKAGVPATWIAYPVPGEKFTVHFPVRPAEAPQQTPAGQLNVFLASDPATADAYTVMVLPLSAADKAALSSNPDSFFKSFAGGFAKSSGSVPAGDRSVTVQGITGREFTFQNVKLGKAIFARTLAVGERMVILTATSTRAVLAGDALAFMESFKVGN